MESKKDYNQERKNLLKIVVDTGDDYPDFDNNSEDSSIDSSSNDMDVDEVSENSEDIDDKQEKNDRQNFIDMFKDKHSYPNTNSIEDSKFLS